MDICKTFEASMKYELYCLHELAAKTKLMIVSIRTGDLPLGVLSGACM